MSNCLNLEQKRWFTLLYLGPNLFQRLSAALPHTHPIFYIDLKNDPEAQKTWKSAENSHPCKVHEQKREQTAIVFTGRKRVKMIISTKLQPESLCLKVLNDFDLTKVFGINFSCFCCRLPTFFKITFFKKFF